MSFQNATYFNAIDDGEFPRHLLEPSYQNRLRVIGNHIDSQHLHSIVLIEVPGGFLLRAAREIEPFPTLVEFEDRAITAMLQQAQNRRGAGPGERDTRQLIPTGYEDLLRALGYELDQRIAENVVIAELPSLIAITGFEPVLGFGESSYRPFSMPLATEDIELILKEAHDRRGTYQHLQSYVPPNFRG